MQLTVHTAHFVKSLIPEKTKLAQAGTERRLKSIAVRRTAVPNRSRIYADYCSGVSNPWELDTIPVATPVTIVGREIWVRHTPCPYANNGKDDTIQQFKSGVS